MTVGPLRDNEHLPEDAVDPPWMNGPRQQLLRDAPILFTDLMFAEASRRIRELLFRDHLIFWPLVARWLMNATLRAIGFSATFRLALLVPFVVILCILEWTIISLAAMLTLVRPLTDISEDEFRWRLLPALFQDFSPSVTIHWMRYLGPPLVAPRTCKQFFSLVLPQTISWIISCVALTFYLH